MIRSVHKYALSPEDVKYGLLKQTASCYWSSELRAQSSALKVDQSKLFSAAMLNPNLPLKEHPSSHDRSHASVRAGEEWKAGQADQAASQSASNTSANRMDLPMKQAHSNATSPRM